MALGDSISGNLQDKAAAGNSQANKANRDAAAERIQSAREEIAAARELGAVEEANAKKLKELANFQGKMAEDGTKDRKERLKFIKKRNELQAEALKHEEKAKAFAEAEKGFREDITKILEKNKKVTESQHKVNTAISEQMNGSLGKFKDMIESLPMGKLISQQADLGGIISKTQEKVTASLDDSFKKGKGGVIAFARAGKVAMAGFGAAVKAAMGPLLLIGLIIAAVVMLVKHMMKMTDQARMFSKELGVANSEGSKLQSKFGTLYAGKGLESMQALNEQLGYNVELSQESANAMNVFNTYGSLAAATMGKVAGNAALIGSDFAEIAKMAKDVASETTGELDILKEIASLSKDTVAHFAGRTKEMVRQAKLAKDMNISLEKTMQVSKGLLDIESSIEAEMTAELLTGKDLNFDAARRLALSGDHAGAVQEITSQVGNMEGMDMIQLESLAAATGMSVGELQGTAQKAEDKTDKRLLKAATATTQMKTIMQQMKDTYLQKIYTVLDGIMKSDTFKAIKKFVGQYLKEILVGMAILLGIIAASNVVGAIRNLGGAFKSGFQGLKNAFTKGSKVPLTKSGTPDKRFKVNQTNTSKVSTPKVSAGGGGGGGGGSWWSKLKSKGSNMLSKGKDMVKTGYNSVKTGVKKGVNVVGNTLKKANPMKWVRNTLKSPIVKGFGKALGPIMVAISGIADVASTIAQAKAQRAEGGEVDKGALGKSMVQAAAYPIANLATNLIPGVGTAISLADAVLGSFGYSPIKWLTDNLVGLVPNKAFTGLGKLAIGKDEVKDNGSAEDFIVQDNKLTKFRKDDIIVGGTNLGGEGRTNGDDIVARLDKLIELMIAGKTIEMDGTQVAKAMALNNIDIGVA
tara:strand:+ start:1292 stop:3880 length:2589 start_codon:yes stop_codon:yes gene_type:complete